MRTLLWAAAYAATAVVGRLTILDGHTLSLVWPAVGVGLLWVLLEGAGPRSLDAVALGAVTMVVNLATGASAALAAVLVAVSLVQVLVTASLLRRWLPGLLGCGGEARLGNNRELGWFTVACSVGTLAGVLLGVLGHQLVEGPMTVEAAVVWWGRTLSGALVVGAVGLLTAHRLRHGRADGPPRRRHSLETAALVVCTVLLYTVGFALDLPLAFPLLVPTVWAGLRFSTLFVGWHSLACAAAGVGFTLAGYGPFAQLADEEDAALMAQLFVALVALTGLAVALNGEERRRLADELRGAEREARDQSTLLATILEEMTDGVCVVDAEGHTLLENRAALRFFGLARPITLDEMSERLLRVDGTPFEADTDRPGWRALAGEQVRDVDVLVRRPDGTDLVLRISGQHLPGAGAGRPARAVLSMHDVTRDLERAEALRQFARVAAHDIRNPVAAIDGWNTMLRRKAEAGELTPELVDRFTGRLGASVERLNLLIDGLLDHATSADRTLALTRIDLGPLLRRIVESRGAEALVTWHDLPAVRADTLLVSQLLDNLVGNALKYVEPGQQPRVLVSAEEHRPGWATIRVTDHGIGIPEDQLETVFDEFQRAHAATFDGTGLGLSIARRVVNRHGGTIRALANPDGPGTTFEFTLPLDPGSGRAAQVSPGAIRTGP